MPRPKSPAEKEYRRRIDLCTKTIFKAAKDAGFGNVGVAENFQGCEIRVDTEVGAEGDVIVLMNTGHPPRLPKYIILTVHGCVWHEVNKRVRISAGGLAASTMRFLPDSGISHVWLRQAITNSADAVRRICSTQNMELLRKQALAKRRQACAKFGIVARHNPTILEL